MESIIAGPWTMVLGLLVAALLGGVIGYILRGWREDRIRSITGSRPSVSTRPRPPMAPEAGPSAPRWAGSSGPQPTTRRVVTPPSPGDPDPWTRPSRAPAEADRADSMGGASLDDGDGPLVLLVDDRLELLALHGSYLHEHGYRVLTAQDGETGLRYAREHRPAVIVLDHSMPRRSGLEVARELKADSVTRAIPILLMTAHSYGAVGVAAKEAGCETFLSKPVAPSRMLREVSVHLPAGARGR